MNCSASATLCTKSSSRIWVIGWPPAAYFTRRRRALPVRPCRAGSRRTGGWRGSAPGQLALEQLVQLGRICLALGRLHDLANEEPEQLVLAGAVIGKLLRILRHDVVDRALDRGRIGDLLQTARLDDLIGCLAYEPHGLEHVLRDLARDRVVVDPREQRRERRRRDAALRDVEVVPIERARQLTHDPVRRELGLAAKSRDDGFVVVGKLAARRQ